MPLTAKGQKIEKNMESEYGKKKGKQVFYASQNKGTITGTHEKGAEVNQAYRAGFEAKCARAGISHEILLKQAGIMSSAGSMAGKALDIGKRFGKGLYRGAKAIPEDLHGFMTGGAMSSPAALSEGLGRAGHAGVVAGNVGLPITAGVGGGAAVMQGNSRRLERERQAKEHPLQHIIEKLKAAMGR